MNKYTIRKFDGDDEYSWAVFLSADLPKDHKGIVFYNDAIPYICGYNHSSAKYERDRLNI